MQFLFDLYRNQDDERYEFSPEDVELARVTRMSWTVSLWPTLCGPGSRRSRTLSRGCIEGP
eukprot:2401676-Lingulodinium_polyedra.AAC.1